MDLKQTKLTKSEWNNTEVSVGKEDKFILKVINDGYNDVNIKTNMNESLFQILKIEKIEENELYLFEKYFDKTIKDILKKYNVEIELDKKKKSIKKPKKVDILRIDNLDSNIQIKRGEIFEFILLDLCNDYLKYYKMKNKKYILPLFTLIRIHNMHILHKNKYVMEFVQKIINYGKLNSNIKLFVENAQDIIEKNPMLMKYENVSLFTHQKELFTIFKEPSPKLVLYIAPTGTGKTLSPIGLSNQYKIIFICVSRHVGLALAKSSISSEKKIAFAFGCETVSDIRLHYFAASEYTINKKTGGIYKVDNSVGNKVEIMICDVQSYLIAMRYMLAFNSETDIITYWDEPTITMDYEDHILHDQIKKNWKENQISKLVLSCATLPQEEEIQESIRDFQNKFDDVEVHSINSYDYRKSISLINKDCKCVLPHLLYKEYNDLLSCLDNCEKNKTLLRYFDLKEVVTYIMYVNEYNLIPERYKIENYFTDVSEIAMDSMKQYYLNCLKYVDKTKWSQIYEFMIETQKGKFENTSTLRRVTSIETTKNNVLTKVNSVDHVNQMNTLNGMLLTTNDAHTLTDGPTIFMANDVNKIAQFYVKMSNIPQNIYNNILDSINKNNILNEKIDKIQMKLDDKLDNNDDNDDKKDRKDSRREENSPEIRKLSQEIENLRMQIISVNLDKSYVPNTNEHQQKWIGQFKSNSYMPNINENYVKRIMELDVKTNMKVLLLMGIGTFDNDLDIRYLEIMKELAYEQKLYIIIASTDYIYGTNYSFCHGYIGKDLTNMTQQKIIQAMGRIGRNKIQQEYTIRFRDDNLIKSLFEKKEYNLEAINMNKLFCSD